MERGRLVVGWQVVAIVVLLIAGGCPGRTKPMELLNHSPRTDPAAKIPFVPGRNELVIAVRHAGHWHVHDKVVYR